MSDELKQPGKHYWVEQRGSGDFISWVILPDIYVHEYRGEAIHFCGLLNEAYERGLAVERERRWEGNRIASEEAAKEVSAYRDALENSQTFLWTQYIEGCESTNALTKVSALEAKKRYEANKALLEGKEIPDEAA